MRTFALAVRGPRSRPMVVCVVVTFAAVMTATGCQGPPPPLVERAKVVLTPLTGGVVRVRGLPGAVMAPNATTVTITTYREAPAPRTLLHLGSAETPIHSTFARVDAERGFNEVWVGSPDRPVQAGDEINVTPYAGLLQAGPTTYVYVP